MEEQLPMEDFGNEEMDGNLEMDMEDGNEFEGDFDDNQFDNDFDAGVDADEENDPKKYIQQLTGKLSQTLRKYNEDLPQPDVDLNKYVAGMINKQATIGLNDEDVNEILGKVKADEEADENFDDGSDLNGDENISMANESVCNKKQKIDELFQQLTNTDETETMEKPLKNITFRKRPFTSPSFS